MENGRVVEEFSVRDKAYAPQSNLARFLLGERVAEVEHGLELAAIV